MMTTSPGLRAGAGWALDISIEDSPVHRMPHGGEHGVEESPGKQPAQPFRRNVLRRTAVPAFSKQSLTLAHEAAVDEGGRPEALGHIGID